MRHMINGTGKLNSQFSSHGERVSEKQNTRHPLFSIVRFDPYAPPIASGMTEDEIQKMLNG
jgi:hypothetical protein